MLGLEGLDDEISSGVAKVRQLVKFPNIKFCIIMLNFILSSIGNKVACYMNNERVPRICEKAGNMVKYNLLHREAPNASI